MRSYHALYNPPSRARRPKANPSSPRTGRTGRARVSRARYPKLRGCLRNNPTDTVEEAVQLVKKIEGESLPKDAKGSRMVEMYNLSPLKYLIVKPGDVIEAMGETWVGHNSKWRWIAFDTAGNAFEEGEASKARLAIDAGRDAQYAAADPAIRAFAKEMLGAGAFGSSTGTLDSKQRARAVAEGFELQTYVPEGYETPLPGSFADRAVPNMPGYVIRVYARLDTADSKDHGFGDRLYYFQVLDPSGRPVGMGDAEPSGGRVDIPEGALVAAMEDYTPNPSKVKSDSDLGIVGPFPTSMQANQTADLVAAIFTGENDMVLSNPSQRRKLTSAARRGLARSNPMFADMATQPPNTYTSLSGPAVTPKTKTGRALGMARSARSGVKKAFNMPEAAVLETARGGVETDEIEGVGAMMGLSADPATSYRMGYYWGIIRGIDSCKVRDIFKRRAFRRELKNKIIEGYNELSQSALQKGARVRTVR